MFRYFFRYKLHLFELKINQTAAKNIKSFFLLHTMRYEFSQSLRYELSQSLRYEFSQFNCVAILNTHTNAKPFIRITVVL